MNITAIVGAGITAAATAVVLRRFGGEFGLFVSLAASIMILYAVVTSITPVVELMNELSDEVGAQSQYILIMMKALAVCIVTRLASECCRDSGEGAIATKLEFAGKTAVLLTAVPLFRTILDIIRGLVL